MIIKKEFKELIVELLQKGFHISSVSLMPTDDLAYHLDGFYKSSGIKLYHDGYSIYAEARYGEVTDLGDYDYPFDGLVHLNYKWWQSSKDRYEGWVSPDVDWLPYLIEKGLVEVEEKVVKIYK